jgi:hypothetical protein
MVFIVTSRAAVPARYHYAAWQIDFYTPPVCYGTLHFLKMRGIKRGTSTRE